MTYDEERVITTRTDETQVGGTPPAYPAQPGYVPPASVPPAYPAQTAAAGSHVSQTQVVRRRRGDLLERVIDLIFGIILILIALRIALLLLAARESNALVSGIYALTEIFVAPFRGILRIDEVDAGRSELDVSAIVAIVGWALIWLLIRAIVRLFRPREYA